MAILKTIRLKTGMKKCFFICLMFLISGAIFAKENFTSADIAASTIKALPHCLRYRLKGVCYWSSPAGIDATPYVEHYLPDVVVSVFNGAGQNAWTEMNQTIDRAGEAVQKSLVSALTGFEAGLGRHSFIEAHEQSVFFKEADVLGNPALSVLPNNGLALLPSTAVPFKPYYQSMLDSAMWRGLPQAKLSLVEEAYALGANVFHHIGTGLINWGGVYPHEGKVESANEAKGGGRHRPARRRFNCVF